jgi:RNA polymerase sigma factor (sigma-70 family)
MAAIASSRIPILIHALTQSELSDGELLRRYAEGRNEDAFAELVRRHGPLVLATCRRVLGETATAEDAFQATFLLLVRKENQLHATGSLAGWLHGVALRTAREARRAEIRRRSREQAHPGPPPALDPGHDITWREVRERLDVELAALPAKYREPLALCYLQELSYEEAAHRIGCSVGALRGRLQRGKELLRTRLARYGLPLGAPFLVLGQPPAVSAALRETTATVVRAGVTGGTVPPGVAVLLGSSVWIKAALVSLGVALLAVAGAVLALCGEPSVAPVPRDQKAAAPEAPAEAQAPQKDVLGDALPTGAVMRLGTLRFQVPTWPFKPLSLPGGKAYLVYHRENGWNGRPELRWMDAETGKVTDSWPLPAGRALAGLSPDGRRALLTDVKVFHTGIRLGPEKPDRSLTAYLYDLTRKQEVQTLRGEFEESEGDMASLHGACFSTDGKWLVTVNTGHGNQGRVRLWSLETGKQVWASEWGKTVGSWFEPLGFTSANAELILRGSENNRIYVVDAARGKLARNFPTMPQKESPGGIHLSPDGTTVLVGGYMPQVRVWDVKSGKELQALTGHKEWARKIAFSPDGKTLVTGGNDDYVLVRDWPSGKVRKRIDLGRGYVGDLFVTADGRTLTVLFWWEKTLERYDLDTGKRVPLPADTHKAEVYGVETTSDGSVISLGRDNVLRTWDPASGRQSRQLLLEPTLYWTPFSLGPEGKLAAVAYDRTAVVIFDRDSGKALRKIATPGREIDWVVFSPEGRWLAGTARDAKTVLVWEAGTGKKVFETSAGPGGWWAGVPACAFSPDGRYFVTTDEGEVHFWEAGDWKAAGSLSVHAGGLAFSPDGRMLACVGLNDVTVWETSTRTLRFKHLPASQASSRPRFSPDGRYLGWLTQQAHALEVWDILGGRPVTTFSGHDGPVDAWTFLPDSKRLVTASEDCTLLVWDLAGPVAQLKAPLAAVEKELRAAWDDLGAPEGEKGFAALRTLTVAGNRGVALICERLRPVTSADAVKVQRLLTTLDSDQFEEREQAATELRALGAAVESQLRKFLAGKPSAEAARLVKELLEALPPAQLRQERALEVLEWIGTQAARDALRHLATGATDARLTIDAKAALRRLGL